MSEKKYKNDFKIVGNTGEDIAAKYLKRNGYKIITRNFLCHQGEIDIIAQKGIEYIFCEVKTRRNKKYGQPIESVNFIKRKHIWDATKYYVYKNNLYNKFIRFDIIEIYICNDKKYINHVKNVEIYGE